MNYLRNINIYLLLILSLLINLNLLAKPVLSGKVVNELGEPVTPCIVQLEGLGRKVTVRDSTGIFLITNLSPGILKINISSRYYASKSFEVYLPDDKLIRVEFTIGKKSDLENSDTIYKPKVIYFNADITTNFDIREPEMHQSVLDPVSIPMLLQGFNPSDKAMNSRDIPGINNKIFIDGIDYTFNFRSDIPEYAYRIINLPSAYSLGSFSAGSESNSAISSNPYYSYELMPLTSFSGYSRFETDIEALNGRASNGIRIVENENGNTYEYTDKGPELLSAERSIFDFGIGGKLDPEKNSTIFFSGYSLIENHKQGYNLLDPIGNNFGRLPDEYYWRRNISARMTIEVGDGFVLTFGGYYGITSIANSDMNWLYATDKGLLGQTERKAKQINTNLNLSNVYFKFNKSLNSDSWYEFKLIYQYHLEESGRPGNFWEPSFLYGYDILKPVDNFRAMNYEFVSGGDGIFDEYQTIYEIRPTSDGLLQGEFRKVNPFTGYIEGDTDFSGTDNPWGLQNIFVTHGNTSLRTRRYDEISTEFEYSNFHKYAGIDHLFKSSIEIGYSFLKSDISGINVINIGLPNPLKMGLRLENKMIYSDLVIAPSFSIRHFSGHPSVKLISDSSESGTYISPAIGINYNVTKYSSINFSFSKLFDINSENKRLSDYGDIPKYNYTRMDISFEYRLLSDLYIEPGYFISNYKDMLLLFPELNGAFFNYKKHVIDQKTEGFILSLNKNFNKNYGFRANYTYLNTTISNGFPGNEYQLYPHTLKADMNLHWGQNEGPRILGIFPLESTGINLVSYFHSGTPYTKTDINGLSAGIAFAERNPEYWEVMLRLEKRIFLSDFFGDKFGRMSVSIILDIYNLFNRTKPFMLYSSTGDAVDDGLILSRSKDDFSGSSYFKDFDPGYPESGMGNQYDSFGNRLYNPLIDTNNDNKVDQNEKYKSWLNYAETKLNLLENFQKPRSVLLSFVIRY